MATFHQYDGLGSTTGLADGAGDVVATYEHDVFGNVRAQTGSSPNEFTYTGEQVDSSGLQYLRARYYDPETGRFLSMDPEPFLQRYAYANNSPTNYVDPSGSCYIEIRLTKVEGFGIGRLNITGWHAYIYTWDPIDKTEKAYRGGSAFNRSGSGSSSDPNLYQKPGADGPGTYGYVRTSMGWASDFPDYDPAFSGPTRVVRYKENESCDRWRSSFAGTSRAINAANEKYYPFGPNSNSVARELLEEAGLSTRKPGQRDHWRPDRYWIPGWGDDPFGD